MINVYLCTTPSHLSTRETFSLPSLFFASPLLQKEVTPKWKLKIGSFIKSRDILIMYTQNLISALPKFSQEMGPGYNKWRETEFTPVLLILIIKK
jgi:hypothetical protein